MVGEILKPIDQIRRKKVCQVSLEENKESHPNPSVTEDGSHLLTNSEAESGVTDPNPFANFS